MVIETILFDLDDTLISEREYVRSGFDAVAQFLSSHEDHNIEWRRLMEDAFIQDRSSVFHQLGQAFEWPIAQIEKCIGIYREHRPTISLLADARACLEWAPPRKTGIVTDGRVRSQAEKIRASGVDEFIDVIVLTGALPKGWQKPDPRPFQVALRELGSRADTTMYVADNRSKDFAGPRRLGMTTVHIVRATGLYADMPACAGGEPDHSISTLNDLPALVSSLER